MYFIAKKSSPVFPMYYLFKNKHRGVLNVQENINDIKSDVIEINNSQILKHGIVKSMQSGTYASKGETTGSRLGINVVSSLTINLSTIDSNKAIFFVRAGHLDDDVGFFPLIDCELTNNKLILYVNANNYTTTKYFQWQVIEFY